MLLANAGQASPRELAVALDEPLNSISYHVSKLRDLGVLDLVDRKPRRGTMEHFYVSNVTERWALLALGLAPQEEEDEGEGET